MNKLTLEQLKAIDSRFPNDVVAIFKYETSLEAKSAKRCRNKRALYGMNSGLHANWRQAPSSSFTLPITHLAIVES